MIFSYTIEVQEVQRTRCIGYVTDLRSKVCDYARSLCELSNVERVRVTGLDPDTGITHEVYTMKKVQFDTLKFHKP